MRTESLVRSGEKTDDSTSSTSSWSDAATVLVVVDDAVAHGVHDRRRPVAEHLGVGLEVDAPGVQVRALAVPHRDDVPLADEHVDLAGLDGVVLVDVPERAQGEEQAVLVPVELGSLVGVERVLDRERVQPEGLRHVGELARPTGSVSPTQTKSCGSRAASSSAA